MNYIFKLSGLFTLLFVLPAIITQGKPVPQNFDKAAFYAALASTNVEEVNSALASLKENALPEKLAYEGALLMKKAGLVSKVKDKLSFFKSGRTKLEDAIKNDAGNVEFHFLRLLIQEHAPKIVKYRSDLKNDAELVRSSFKKLPFAVQQVVRDYSKQSSILKPADF